MKYWVPIALVFALNACAPLPIHEGYEYCSYQGRLRECVTVPLARQDEDAMAKQFAPPRSGKGRIYLVRPYTQQPKIKSMAYLDDRPLAQMGPRTYVVVDVEPGGHLLKMHTEEDVVIAIDVKPGQIYYLQYERDLLFFTVTEKLKQLDAGKAQPKIRQSKRAVSLIN